MRWVLLASALLLVWASGHAPGAAPAVDEATLREMFRKANHQEHSVFAAETAIRQMRTLFPDSPHLAFMEYVLGHKLLLAFIRDGYIPDGSGPFASLAMEHLGRFAPGEPLAQAPQAPQARALYAKTLLINSRPDEAKAVLLDVAKGGEPSAQLAALKTLACLREPLAVDEPEWQSVETGLARIQSQPPRLAPEAEEFLSALSVVRDPALGADYLYGQAQFHVDTVLEMRRIKSDAGVKSHAAEALEAAEGFLAAQPAAPPATDLERWAKAHFWVSLGAYETGDWAKSMEAAAPILYSKDRPELQPIHAAVEARLYWNQCREALSAASLQEIDADLLDLLGQGKCRADEIAWIFKKLASHAARRGDRAQQYLYLRDLRDRLYENENTYQVVKDLAKMEEDFPELTQAPKEIHSPADDALAAAGLVANGAIGFKEAVGKTVRHAAKAGKPGGKGPRYYKTLASPKEDVTEP